MIRVGVEAVWRVDSQIHPENSGGGGGGQSDGGADSGNSGSSGSSGGSSRGSGEGGGDSESAAGVKSAEDGGDLGKTARRTLAGWDRDMPTVRGAALRW